MSNGERLLPFIEYKDSQIIIKPQSGNEGDYTVQITLSDTGVPPLSTQYSLAITINENEETEQPEEEGMDEFGYYIVVADPKGERKKYY